MKSIIALTVVAPLAAAFPFMGEPNVPRENAEVFRRQSDDQCPTRSDHTGAVPFNPQYPYLGADPAVLRPGTGKGGIQVPAPGDTAHRFIAPGPNDIRGPCPGLNAAANHGFLSRDGIVTYNELVAAQQNMYNVGFDLANVLATAGVGLTGDVITQKMSLGCESTERTAVLPVALQRQPGLNGHNKFEADTSLTRNDYFLNYGDNFRFNSALFKLMDDTVGGVYSRQSLGEYRADRWRMSRAGNGNFFFGPGSLLLYGAASFLYELFPGSSHPADTNTQMSFFGASRSGDGFVSNGRETIPNKWRNRVSPYDLGGVGGEIRGMYGANKYLFIDENGMLNFDPSTDLDNTVCGIFQLALAGTPSQATGLATLPRAVIDWAAGNINPLFRNFGCPNLLQ